MSLLLHPPRRNRPFGGHLPTSPPRGTWCAGMRGPKDPRPEDTRPPRGPKQPTPRNPRDPDSLPDPKDGA